jgi:hypothetical protein
MIRRLGAGAEQAGEIHEGLQMVENWNSACRVPSDTTWI